MPVPVIEIDKRGMTIALLCGFLITASFIIALTAKSVYGIILVILVISAFAMSVIVFWITAQTQQIREAKKKN